MKNTRLPAYSITTSTSTRRSGKRSGSHGGGSSTCKSSSSPGGRNDVSPVAIGVVVVDHGSKRREANAMLDDVAQMCRNMFVLQSYEAQPNIVAVEKAHMELVKPSVEDAVTTCVKKHKVDVVVVAPYFLSKGRHIQEDIPRLVEKAQAMYPEVVCVMAEPIGLDARVVDVVHSRVKDALVEVLVNGES